MTRWSSGDGRSGCALLSVSDTSSPRAARKFAAATPDFPAPTTRYLLIGSCHPDPERSEGEGAVWAGRHDDRATHPHRFLASLGMTCSSKFQSRKTQQGKNDGDDPAPHDHLRLAPSGE